MKRSEPTQGSLLFIWIVVLFNSIAGCPETGIYAFVGSKLITG